MEWAQEGERETIKMGDTFDLTIQSVQPLTYNHSPVISLVGAVLRQTVKECDANYFKSKNSFSEREYLPYNLPLPF